MIKLEKKCIRLYRYYDHSLPGMITTTPEFDKYQLIADYDFHSETSTLMEGVKIDGVEYFEGDISISNSGVAFMLEADKYGTLWFIRVGEHPMHLWNAIHYGLKIAGNIFENPGLMEEK